MKNLRTLFFRQKSCNCGNFLQAVDFLEGWTTWKGGLPESSPLGEEGPHWGLNGLMAKTREEQVFPALGCAPLLGGLRDPGNSSLPAGHSKMQGSRKGWGQETRGPLEVAVTQEVNFTCLYILGKGIHTHRERLLNFSKWFCDFHNKG